MMMAPQEPWRNSWRPEAEEVSVSSGDGSEGGENTHHGDDESGDDHGDDESFGDHGDLVLMKVVVMICGLPDKMKREARGDDGDGGADVNQVLQFLNSS